MNNELASQLTKDIVVAMIEKNVMDLEDIKQAFKEIFTVVISCRKEVL